MSVLYDLIFITFSLVYLPRLLLTKKFHKDFRQRFGIFDKSLSSKLSTMDSPIWLHAVSVGEVAAIRPFWKRLREEFPSKRIIVSTVTKTGNAVARKFADDNEAVFYLPLDFSFVINAVIRRIGPHALILAETELWPNLINCCYKKNIPIILLNGRVSDKAFRRYRIVRFALKDILRKIYIFCARSKEDAEKFIALGAPPQRVLISGNMKYCDTDDNVKAGDIDSMRRAFGMQTNDLILMAGSTHRGEEEIIFEVFDRLRRDFQALRLIVAPRHIERAGEVKRLGGRRDVVVVDKLGVLKELYSIADIVFVGGSLVMHGGHNIIEPALFGKPIIFGPHMFNFKEVADEFLKGRAAIMVKDRDELEINCRRLLEGKEERVRLGENAKNVVLKNQGAVEICVSQAKRVLGGNG